MTLTLDLPLELERQLRSEAERRGLTPGDYVLLLLKHSLVLSPETRAEWQWTRREEWLQAFDSWFAASGQDQSTLPDEAYSREVSVQPPGNEG